MQGYGAQSQWIQLQNIFTPKAPETLRKRGWKACKVQRFWEFAVKVCLLVMSEAIHMKSHCHDCPNMRQMRMTPTDMPACTGTSP